MNRLYNIFPCVILILLLIINYSTLEVYGLTCYLCFYPETNTNGFSEVCENSKPQDCNTIEDAAMARMIIAEASMAINLTARDRKIMIEHNHADLLFTYRPNPKVACGKQQGGPINGVKHIIRACVGLNGTWEDELPLCHEDGGINNCICNGDNCNSTGRLEFSMVGVYLALAGIFGYMTNLGTHHKLAVC